MRSTDVWHARNRIIRYSLSLISNATQRLLLFAFRTKRKQQHINNLNRKWNQIKIPKNKRCTHTIAHTVRQTKFIKSILQMNPNKQIENHSPVHSQKLKAFVCCVFAMAKRSLLPLLLYRFNMLNGCLHYAPWFVRTVYCSENNRNHTQSPEPAAIILQ